MTKMHLNLERMVRVRVVLPGCGGDAMEKQTLKRLGEGLRKALPVSHDLPANMHVALLRIAAQEMKPEFTAALGQLLRQV